MPVDRPTYGAHVQELHDRLVLHFPPRRCWPAVAFVLLWLALLTTGSIDTLNAVVTGNDSSWRLLALGPFAVVEYFVARWIARQLWEHQFLVATPHRIEVRLELGPFSRSRSCPIRLVRAVQAVEKNNDDETRESYVLEIVHRDGRIRVGGYLVEADAERLASVVRSWLEQQAGWVEPIDAATSDWLDHARSALFPAVVVVVLAFIAYTTLLSRAPADASRTPVRAPEGPTVDDLAATTTLRTLSSLSVLPRGTPSCHAVTSTWWSCEITAREADAGAWVTYRCEQIHQNIHCWPLRAGRGG